MGPGCALREARAHDVRLQAISSSVAGELVGMGLMALEKDPSRRKLAPSFVVRKVCAQAEPPPLGVDANRDVMTRLVWMHSKCAG